MMPYPPFSLVLKSLKTYIIRLYNHGSYYLMHLRATISPKKSNKKCFKYARTVAMNHKKVKNHLERVNS